ncbi:hypothetical protein ACU10_11095 [Xanthomonas oryzae pv. oryzicola]|nr:hypothetical protein ACU13_11150 [Xanthomonas oryzae pv. oryzicola]AKN97244.1 hypothetical protein ACU10_11095 [Xanthomonas oryzae pv. oryzicola]AKO12459.1 hypothetical protein ACU14_11095 [Xanthomonas oryzae pv. oryzicola]AKO16206.1 hypothetical protein ACU12_11140 [Xanthomonas oryzae pv. oryzicola]AKO19729.1 hypothetical protein ACU11_09970 [Xanthomonas oryzae pv. oryzicola]
MKNAEVQGGGGVKRLGAASTRQTTIASGRCRATCGAVTYHRLMERQEQLTKRLRSGQTGAAGTRCRRYHSRTARLLRVVHVHLTRTRDVLGAAPNIDRAH